MTDGDISLNLTLQDQDFTVTVKNAGRLLSELRQNLQTTADASKTVGNHFSSFTTHLRHTVMTLASVRFMMMDINDVFLTLPKSIIKTSGEIERLTKLMEGLSKETTEAGRKMEAASNTKFIFDMAKNAPFEVKALSDAFVKFKSAGIDPTNGSMKALVDSVARFGGNSEQLHRASIAIQQMAGKGVISMEELRQQLGEAVPSAMRMMAAGAGMSMQTLIKHISKGQVESKSALERMFAVMRAENDGAAAAMMETWSGVVERFKTVWDLAKVEMGKGGLFDTAKEELNKLTDAFDGTQMRQFSSDIAFVTAQAAKGFAVMIDAVRKYYDEIKLVGEVIVAAFAASKLTSMGTALITPIVTAYKNGVAEMGKAIDERNQKEIGAHSMAIARAKEREAALIEEKALAQATYAQMNNDYNAMVTKRAALDREQGKFKSQAYAALLNAQIQALEAEMLATKNNAIAHRGRAQALEAEIIAQRANIAALEAQTVAQERLTVSARAFGAMRGMLQGIWTAMGGWIGAVTIALTAGIMAWADYAAAAERAAQRAKNAARGISDAKALAEAQSERDKTAKQVADWEDEKFSKNAGFAADGNVWTKADEAALEAKKKRLNELNGEIKNHQENLEKDRIEHAVNLAKREADREAAGVTNAWRQANETKLKALDDARKAIEEKYADNNEKLKAELKKFDNANEAEVGRITREGELGRLSSLRALLESQNTRLRQEAQTANADRKKEIEAILATNQKGIDEFTNLIKQAEKIGTSPNLIDTKDGKEKKSELERWLERVRGKVAQINAELNQEGTGTIAKMLGTDLDKIAGMNPALKSKLQQQFLPELLKEQDIERNKEYAQILQRIQNELTETEVALEGGVNGIEKMRNALLDLGAADPDNAPLMANIRKALALLDDLEAKKSELNFRGLSQDLTTATASLRAGMSDDGRDSAIAQWAKDLAEHRKKIDDAKLSMEDLQKANKEYFDYAQARTDKMMRDTAHPMDKLAREWANTTKLMEQATTSWADKVLDTFMELATTGKADFKSLASSILTDILRIQMKEAYGGAITSAVKVGQQAMTGAINWMAGKTDDNKEGSTKGMSMFGGMIEKAGTSLKGFWNSITGATEATDKQTESTGNSIMTTIKEIFGITTKTTAEQGATMAVANLAIAAEAAAQALSQVAMSGGGSSGGGIGGLLGSFFGGGSAAGAGGAQTASEAAVAADINSAGMGAFANGGIMTQFGPVALRKYANGGIAKSPQLALFGEGSMNEAYVPLPDGRSIPVTITSAGGGGGSNVVISIVVNNNGEGDTKVSTTSSGDQQTYKNMAEQIKNIVVEQMVVQQRPGGVLYRG